MSHNPIHHHHHHDHSFGAGENEGMRRILWISIALNMLFVLVEAVVGVWQNSLSLLSDAGHNLSDVFSLALVLVGLHLVKAASNKHYTYGYKKSTVLISLCNAVLLLVAVGVIIAESVHKLQSPVATNGAAISWTAGAGILVNGITTLLLMRGGRQDLNIRGAFLHMAADTLVSVGVVISGVIIAFTGWFVIDPVISIVIACVILFSTWDLLHDSLRLILDGVPEEVDAEEIERLMRGTPHVADVHHIHIWALSTTQNALTAHVVVDETAHAAEVRHAIKHSLAEHGISHATIETETPDSLCEEHDCC